MRSWSEVAMACAIAGSNQRWNTSGLNERESNEELDAMGILSKTFQTAQRSYSYAERIYQDFQNYTSRLCSCFSQSSYRTSESEFPLSYNAFLENTRARTHSTNWLRDQPFEEGMTIYISLYIKVLGFSDPDPSQPRVAAEGLGRGRTAGATHATCGQDANQDLQMRPNGNSAFEQSVHSKRAVRASSEC